MSHVSTPHTASVGYDFFCFKRMFSVACVHAIDNGCPRLYRQDISIYKAKKRAHSSVPVSNREPILKNAHMYIDGFVNLGHIYMTADFHA